MADPRPEGRPDPRPAPRWGQYADIPPAPPEPQYPPPSLPDPASAPRRTGDMVLSTLLLLIGVFDVVAQWSLFAALGTSLREAYRLQGFGEFTSIAAADSAGAILNLLRVALLVAAIIWTLRRIARGRRAIWIPLGAGVLAALLTIVVLFIVMLQDPALMEYVQQNSPTAD